MRIWRSLMALSKPGTPCAAAVPAPAAINRMPAMTRIKAIRGNLETMSISDGRVDRRVSRADLLHDVAEQEYRSRHDNARRYPPRGGERLDGRGHGVDAG